jgi:cytidylate kinase
MGCGGTRIASFVADELKLDLYDAQRLRDEALNMGIRSEELKSLDEKAPGFLDHLRSYRTDLYLDLMESVIYEVARRGKGVILGHGSQLLLREFGCALHVRIHASEAFRIQQLVRERGVSEETAEKLVHKSDHERRGFLRFAFHMDWNDLSLYDLVINVEKIGREGAADLIIQAALLRNNFALTMFHIEVPAKGLARIRGFAYTEEEKDQLKRTLKDVPGVSNLDFGVSVIPPGVT